MKTLATIPVWVLLQFRQYDYGYNPPSSSGGSSFIWLLFFLITVILIVRYIAKARQNLEHSHWSTLVDNCKLSTQAFYQRLGEELESKEIEGLSHSTVELYTGSVLSEQRLYLRVQWNEYVYDCCCAPYGTGTFFSWWLYPQVQSTERLLVSIPWVGVPLAKLMYPSTYYKRDTATMFMTYTHNCVLAVIDEMTTDTGYRIPDNQRIPTISEALKR